VQLFGGRSALAHGRSRIAQPLSESPGDIQILKMAPVNSLLPTRDHCLALTDEQCHQILEHRDPQGSRANKDWELQHQPQLVRLYMTMLSFPDIQKAMGSKLDWS